MTRIAAIVVGLALVVAVPAADGAKRPSKRRHGHSARFAPLRGAAGPARAAAPSSWSGPRGFTVPVLATPTPTQDPVDPAPTPTATPTVPAPSPHSVSVGSTEFKFTLSQAAVDAGDVRVQFDNSRAEDPHQLMVVGTDDLFDFGELGPGEVKRLTLPLKSGTYDLLCPLLDHESRGMSASLIVR
jgi:plastocyanin